MPNPDGSLTTSDEVTLSHALNRMIPFDEESLAAGSLGLLEKIEENANTDPITRSALLRVVDALSFDMMAHAVGGFSALTVEEQITSIKNVESVLPSEFNTVLNIARDVYYEDARTPDKPDSFDTDGELFGKSTEQDFRGDSKSNS